MNNLLSPSSSLPAGELPILIWATIGGALVFIGLATERFADWMNDRYVGGIEKPHKPLETIGWCILMFGIFVEIAVAGWSANDAWQTRQMVMNNKARTLRLSDQRFLESTLSLYPDKPRIVIFLNEQVSDVQNLGQQLFDCFSHAHFPMNPQMVYGESLTDEHGVLVGGYGITNQTPDAIVDALKKCGLDAKTNGGSISFPNEILIRIEKK